MRYHIDTLRAIHDEVGAAPFTAAGLRCFSHLSQSEKAGIMTKFHNIGFTVRDSRLPDRTAIWRLADPVVRKILLTQEVEA